MKFIKIFPLIVLFLIAIDACSSPAPIMPGSTPVFQEVESQPNARSAQTPAATEEQVMMYPYYLQLVTHPDESSQTLNGVTVSIDWVYVDESRVALRYTVSGLDWPDGGMLDTTSVSVTSKVVSDIGYGGSGGSSAPASKGTLTSDVDLLFVDGVLDANEHPQIDLSVDIPLRGPTAIVDPNAPPEEAFAQVLEGTPSEIGTFHFELHVPVYKGIKIENIDRTVVTNDVSMTLKTLVLNPSHAEAMICFQMPSAVDWGLSASTMHIGGREYPFSGGSLLPNTDGKDFSLTDPERCNSVGFDILYDESISSLTLSVPKLIGSIPELIDGQRVDRANQRLEASGIQFDYTNLNHGGNIEILKRPEGATNMEIYPRIWEALSDQYEGPWIFTVELK